MVNSGYIPSRGDIIWVNFTPQAGHEQAGRRPGLVVSPQAYNRKTGLSLVCPITSRPKGYPFEVPLPPAGSVTGVVLADQVKNLDWQARQARLAGQAPAQVVNEAIKMVRTLVDSL